MPLQEKEEKPYQPNKKANLNLELTRENLDFLINQKSFN